VATEVQGTMARPTLIEGEAAAVDATAATLTVLLANVQTVNLTVPQGAQIVFAPEDDHAQFRRRRRPRPRGLLHQHR